MSTFEPFYTDHWIVRMKDHSCYLLRDAYISLSGVTGILARSSTLADQMETWEDEPPKSRACPTAFNLIGTRRTISDDGVEMAGAVDEWAIEYATGFTPDNEAMDAFTNFIWQTAERYIPDHPFQDRQDESAEPHEAVDVSKFITSEEAYPSLKFELGDEVESAPDSSDILVMKATWIAIIYKIVGHNDYGGCYETLGHWSDEDPSGKLTLRQLWGRDLTHRSA